MSVPSLLEEPSRVDEPQAAQEYAAVLTQVVAAGRPVIVRRNGEDLAAVVPLEHLELVREILAHHEAERSAAEIDWTRARMIARPPQSWFDDEEDNPFEPERGPGVVSPSRPLQLDPLANGRPGRDHIDIRLKKGEFTDARRPGTRRGRDCAGKARRSEPGATAGRWGPSSSSLLSNSRGRLT